MYYNFLPKALLGSFTPIHHITQVFILSTGMNIYFKPKITLIFTNLIKFSF